MFNIIDENIKKIIEAQSKISKNKPSDNKILFVGPEGIGKSHGIIEWKNEQLKTTKNKVFYIQYSDQFLDYPYLITWNKI